ACSAQVARQLSRFPDTVPLVLEPDVNFFKRIATQEQETARQFLSKKRFAVSREWTVAQFMQSVRQKLRLPSAYAMFLFVSREPEDNVLPCNSSTMEEVYAEHADPSNGILWVTLVVERTFGA
ncbi:MAG: hypothetical protein EOO40_09855, partial [Deltaproteobacteria bacterium]